MSRESDQQASVAGLVPGAAGLGLLPPPGTANQRAGDGWVVLGLRLLGDVAAATARAADLARAIGVPLPVPRYVDVAGVRFSRRVSCCLLCRVSHEPLCVSCPRRPAA